MSGEFVPEIWSKELVKRFGDSLTMQEILEQNRIVLTLGPNIGLTLAQVNGAIQDEATDPIIRDALTAYLAKHRILGRIKR